MFAKIFLCSIMSLLILFFGPMCSNFSITSFIYAAFLIFIYIRMTFCESAKKVRYRRIFQITFAVLFCITFISDLYAERGSMAITEDAMSNGEIPFCHITIPQVFVPFIITKNIIFPARISGHYAAIASMLVIWLFSTLILGRGWCSWVCFYGGWEEGFRHIGKKRRLNFIPKNKEFREFQFGFLLFIILLSLCEMSAIYCEWFCPFKLVTEFNPVHSIPDLIAMVLFVGIFLVFVVILPILTKRRTQCSTLCPFGAFASITDKISMFKIRIDENKCSGCMKCVNTCPFGAIDIKTIQDKKGKPEMTCAKCGECVAVCPSKAISFEFRTSHKCESENFKPKTKIGKAFQPLLNPEYLFQFAAYSFGAIMSASWGATSLQLIFDAVIGK